MTISFNNPEAKARSPNVHRCYSFTSDRILFNAGVDFDPETSPGRLVSISEAGGAVSLGASMFAMAQGVLGNRSIRVVPRPGHHIFLRPQGTAKTDIASDALLENALRVGKDLQSLEPCARGLTAFVQVCVELCCASSVVY